MKTICALDLHPGLRASGGKNRIAVGPNNLWENQGLLILPPPLAPPLAIYDSRIATISTEYFGRNIIY